MTRAIWQTKSRLNVNILVLRLFSNISNSLEKNRNPRGYFAIHLVWISCCFNYIICQNITPINLPFSNLYFFFFYKNCYADKICCKLHILNIYNFVTKAQHTNLLLLTEFRLNYLSRSQDKLESNLNNI